MVVSRQSLYLRIPRTSPTQSGRVGGCCNRGTAANSPFPETGILTAVGGFGRKIDMAAGGWPKVADRCPSRISRKLVKKLSEMCDFGASRAARLMSEQHATPSRPVCPGIAAVGEHANPRSASTPTGGARCAACRSGRRRRYHRRPWRATTVPTDPKTTRTTPTASRRSTAAIPAASPPRTARRPRTTTTGRRTTANPVTGRRTSTANPATARSRPPSRRPPGTASLRAWSGWVPSASC